MESQSDDGAQVRRPLVEQAGLLLDSRENLALGGHDLTSRGRGGGGGVTGARREERRGGGGSGKR